ncbi:hypothetical protein [Burkholderia sp. WP9]|uniref:hypothetical protein n=1 Tax=Burkholderia sp. WP9 TaxID=1500263 RepID=UPI00116001B7|nr:hypothetical protein [Burkholderia sp. WP9]
MRTVCHALHSMKAGNILEPDMTSLRILEYEVANMKTAAWQCLHTKEPARMPSPPVSQQFPDDWLSFADHIRAAMLISFGFERACLEKRTIILSPFAGRRSNQFRA